MTQPTEEYIFVNFSNATHPIMLKLTVEAASGPSGGSWNGMTQGKTLNAAAESSCHHVPSQILKNMVNSATISTSPIVVHTWEVRLTLRKKTVAHQPIQ